MQEKNQERAEQVQEIKKKYGKPIFTEIRLFADRVLTDCDPLTAPGADGSFISY